MGIRIHKALGYHLDLSQIPNPNKNFLSGGDDESIWSPSHYSTFLKKIEKEIAEQSDRTAPVFQAKLFIAYAIKRNEDISLSSLIHFDDEFLGPDHLIITPLSHHKQWFRHDDDIDYQLEANCLGNPDPTMETKVEFLRSSIYPYVGRMRRNDALPYGVEPIDTPPLLMGEDKKKASQPYIPLSVQFLLREIKLVPDDQLLDAFFAMRPAVATWWS